MALGVERCCTLQGRSAAKDFVRREFWSGYGRGREEPACRRGKVSPHKVAMARPGVKVTCMRSMLTTKGAVIAIVRRHWLLCLLAGRLAPGKSVSPSS